ncbi:MAG: acetyl-CoA carboxylase carboxyl transferase subunit beta [Alphaproteobacteria bacterium]|nr:acetyl-CoA carboxylase carboxyl transferase subunit beta [Alphaproteobacteria bacterium]
MSWLNEFVRPKIRKLVGKKDVPDNLWQKCPSCEQMLFHRELSDNLHVCHACGHHLRLAAKDRLTLLFDNGEFTGVGFAAVTADPLKFRDNRRYTDRLKDAKNKSGEKEAILVGHGTVSGQNAVIAAFDFGFMGGSMGQAVGEGLLSAARAAIDANAALIVVPASGGARMQEGMLSLIQMPRTILAVEQVREAGLPYIVILTDPTTGGVSASFAMIGDIQIAEPGANIGFAGKRVIRDTIREELPEGFQTSESLLDHGMLDMVVPRSEMRATVGNVLALLRDGRTKRSSESGIPVAGISATNNAQIAAAANRADGK